LIVVHVSDYSDRRSSLNIASIILPEVVAAVTTEINVEEVKSDARRFIDERIRLKIFT
jgi:hypothetical protein